MYDEVNYNSEIYDNDCQHERRFQYKGFLTCQDCGATYDELLLAWIDNSD